MFRGYFESGGVSSRIGLGPVAVVVPHYAAAGRVGDGLNFEGAPAIERTCILNWLGRSMRLSRLPLAVRFAICDACGNGTGRVAGGSGKAGRAYDWRMAQCIG